MLKNHEGQRVPSTVFKIRRDGKFIDLNSDDLFRGKTAVVFSLPGAFTPTCSSSHLPRFNELAPLFKRNGVDEIVCIAVNDAFVMEAWCDAQRADQVTLLPDGNGDFTRAMDMLVDKAEIGFGPRSWRYSMLVKDGIIVKQFIEPEVPGDPFEVSDAETMLRYINPAQALPPAVTIITKPGCPYCVKAKRMLRDGGIPFEEIEIGGNLTLRSVTAITGADTVPQIFVDGKRIGGSEALESYLAARHAA